METDENLCELWVSIRVERNTGVYCITQKYLSDLGLLKRDKKLQIRYDEWAKGIKEQYGSIGEAVHVIPVEIFPV